MDEMSRVSLTFGTDIKPLTHYVKHLMLTSIRISA